MDGARGINSFLFQPVMYLLCAVHWNCTGQGPRVCVTAVADRLLSQDWGQATCETLRTFKGCWTFTRKPLKWSSTWDMCHWLPPSLTFTFHYMLYQDWSHGCLHTFYVILSVHFREEGCISQCIPTRGSVQYNHSFSICSREVLIFSLATNPF